MSSAVERAISVKVCPVTGDGFSKYSPLLGGTNSPPMKLSYRLWTDTGLPGWPGAAYVAIGDLLAELPIVG